MRQNYFNFLVLVDGSKKSIYGLEMAFKLKNPEDKIHVFYIPESKEQRYWIDCFKVSECLNEVPQIDKI